MKFYVYNLGCRVNRSESDHLEALLEAQGLERGGLADADLIVVNTCTVTSEAARKSRKAAHHARRHNPKARIMVTGCAVNIDPADFADFESIGDKAALGAKLRQITFEASGQQEPGTLSEVLPPPAARVRHDLKIQDGCGHDCAYCIVRKARGGARSLPVAKVLDGLSHWPDGETVFTGIDLGAYRDGDLDLAALLRLCLPRLGRGRIRLSSIEPTNLKQDLVDLIAESDGRICRHLHIPLQSGSDRILHNMSRPYDRDFYLTLVKRIRSRIPKVALSSDVIVGLPGESESDFADTIELCQACAFSKIHVFRYSARRGTPAANMPDQVDEAVKIARSQALRNLGQHLRATDLASRAGNRERVVVERTGLGTSESYHKIKTPRQARPGDLIEMVL
ncbi:MAG: MiaB/RimO family radical SAM methylthiotransferase [Coriobacteriales bacterium]|nr:MiaB/RimO family radical SAM methylthiotransferase [Coriobacteriales bacterium]